MTTAIETVALSKRFTVSQGYRDLLPFRKRRRVEALRGVSLQVPRGEVFGILGQNGAGKTTLFKVLGTLILPTSGQARVMGLDVGRQPQAVKQVLTYVISEERSLYWRLTGWQNLQYFATLNEIPHREARRRISRLLSLLELESSADRRVMYYSTGMKQKLALARGLLTDPAVLLLDEPARSLDPLMARSLWQFIREELVDRQGKTVLLATHNLDEARRVCDRVAVLHQGQIRACGSVAELTAMALGQYRYSLTLHASANGVYRVLAETPGVLEVRVNQPTGDETASGSIGPDRTVSYDILIADPEAQVPLVLERVIAARGKVLSCTPHEQSLGDVLGALARGSE